MSKRKKIIIIGIIMGILAIITRMLLISHVPIKELSSEDKRTLAYNELTADSSNIDNCEYVKFSSFFIKDVNGDGYAERYDGTCNRLDQRVSLYFDVNVQTDGRVENGSISVEGKNFELSTALVSDDVIKQDYIGKNSKIELNTINSRYTEIV